MGQVITGGRLRVPLGVAAALLAASALSACGGSGGHGGSRGSSTATPTAPATSRTTATTAPADAASTAPASATGTPTAARQVRASVYFLQAGKLSPGPRPVPAPATAAGALRALLAGPNAFERAHGRSTAIPSGTALRSVAVHAGVATVDLSARYDDGAAGASARQRLAQVVFTATRFGGIGSVRFEVGGIPVTALGGVSLSRPVGRADFEAVSPAVLMESPLIGDTVRSPLRVWGTADTFEAVFRLRLTDAAGHTAADVQVKAASGTGTRGAFDVTFPYRATRTGPGTLTAYYVSPANGSDVTAQSVPLTVNR